MFSFLYISIDDISLDDYQTCKQPVDPDYPYPDPDQDPSVTLDLSGLTAAPEVMQSNAQPIIIALNQKSSSNSNGEISAKKTYLANIMLSFSLKKNKII